MQTQLLAMLILASWVQERGDARRRPEPAGRRVTVNVRVAAGYREIRQVTVTIPAPPAPADEDDPPPKPVRRLNINDLPPQPVRRLNIKDAVVDRENFDRWLFEAEPAEESRQRHLDHLLRARVEAAARRHTLTAPQRAKLLLAGGRETSSDSSIKSRTNAATSRPSGRLTGPASRHCAASNRSSSSTGKARSARTRSSPRRSRG